MKKIDKIFSIILAILMVMSIIPITASAATYTGACGDNATWTYDSSTYTLTISGTGDMYDYKYNNRPWEIYEDNIKTLIINDGIKTIGKYAFYDFDKLTAMTVSDSVTSIGVCALYSCDNLTQIVIPNNVTRISDRMFAYCKNLKNVTIPNGVTTISKEAFYSCTALECVTIPDSVISIDNYAFARCESLKNVTIPNSVTTIGEWAFFSHNGLVDGITVDDNNQHFSSDEYGVLFNKDKTTIIQYPVGNTRTSYKIPDSVKTIGEGAFNSCSFLTDVIIGDSVTAISNQAFSNCSNLKNVIVGNKVQIIDSDAFSWCPSLTTISIPNSVTTIGYKAFNECSTLTNVIIGNGVITIGESAFEKCVNLTNVIVPNSTTTIGDFAFYECYLLTSVTIHDTVMTIGESSFNYCNNLTDVYYTGTEEQWKSISIDDYNDRLLNATIHYNYHIHKYNPVVTPPTCTEQGYTTYTCECGDTYVGNYVDATGHNYEMVVTPPTCTEQGFTTYTCECGDSYVDDYVDVLGHDMIIDEAIAPDCVNTGLTKGSHCSRCDNATTEQEIVSATGHSHTSEITTLATHTATGVMTYTCTCGDTYTETIDKLADHNHEAVVTPPTCTKQGYTTYICACGDSYVDDYVDETRHTYGEWIVTKEATTDTEGEMKRVCSCGEKEYKSIDKLHAVEDNDMVQENINKEDIKNPEIPDTNYESTAIAYSLFMLIIFAVVIERVTFIRKKRYWK